MTTAEEQNSATAVKPTKEEEQEEEEEEEQEEAEEENGVKRRRRRRRKGGDEEENSDWSSSSSSSSESDSDSDAESEAESDSEPLVYVRPGQEREDGDENTEENNIRRLGKILDPKKLAQAWEEEEEMVEDEDELFNFPKDPENWREEDLMELWDDAPLGYTKPGWDPDWADEQDWKVMRKEVEEGREPPIKPFYVPYRQPYPVIPDNHCDIATPKDVIHELDRIEEFLKWVSFIFPDESTYEGTVWDDMAHGRGVFVAQNGLVRYEGEWFQNDMAGHGVVEVEIPGDEPIPGSEHEAQMRAEGRVISRDFMSPEDREWLEMDIEDSLLLADGEYQIPWYERDEWITYYGTKPEKGRYRYAGEFKHGRMHGCGQYEVNERTIYGRFYFGKLLEEPYGCEGEIAAMHAGIAEVAAAKARMFINKPDGMVREMRGPYNDPQHPYFYEEDDVWMAPGFINQFYEVPDYWKVYVGEVDKERQMWLNSFYRSPLRLPMPAELEYWWQTDDTPEFVILDSEPKPDGEEGSNEENAEPRLLHTPTGRIINSRVDKEHGIRLYWEPENGVVDPDKIEYLPLGMDEFFGLDTGPQKESLLTRFRSALEKKSMEVLEKIEKWADEGVELAELKMELLDRELDLEEAEKCLEEALKEVEDNLKTREKEEESGLKEQGKEETLPRESDEKQDEKAVVGEDEGEDEEDDEDDDDDAPASFGSVIGDQNSNKSDPKRGKPGQSPFSASSLSFATSTLVSGIPSLLQRSFLSWKKSGSMSKISPSSRRSDSLPRVDSVSFSALSLGSETQSLKLRAKNHRSNGKVRRISSLASLTKPKKGSEERGTHRSCGWLNATPESELDTVLSLHTPLDYLEKLVETNDDAKPVSSSV